MFRQPGVKKVVLDVVREELKYRVSLWEAHRLMGALGAVMPADVHNSGGAGYMVRSLYFDSLDNTDFFEKEDGVENRKKIRLRIYDPEDKKAKLELKEKFGRFQRKRSLTITREQAEALISGDYSPLGAHAEPLAQELYAIMRAEVYLPRCIVQYNRAAFTVPTNDTRVTFDMRLEVSEAGFALFSPAATLYPAASYDDVTMEVKYNHFLLGYIRDILHRCDRLPVAYSKYYMARGISYTVL
ncbi:polyphosphate polymerase domain-containing protein [Oscillospiraceae bacterium OttesenSCG-928-F05]|nr:polyphosphate polymerase domain-containing protein [Oscillospiraceae bacterium OttesenSCG-928-F05]